MKHAFATASVYIFKKAILKTREDIHRLSNASTIKNQEFSRKFGSIHKYKQNPANHARYTYFVNMAKWGEGDPRWIVEERPDATNVNNWHWTEKNADSWSKKKLEELFVNQVIESPSVGSVVIEELEKCDGEARVNNRKAKLIFFYEWELKLKWKGHVNGKDEPEVKGTIEIPNLSEEHSDMKDVDIEVNLTTKGPEATILKELLRKGDGAKAIRDKLKGYVDALKTEFGANIILPAKDSIPAPKAKTGKICSTFRNFFLHSIMINHIFINTVHVIQFFV